MSHRQNGSHKSWGSQNFTVLVGTGIFFECLSLSARTLNWAPTRQRSQRIIIYGILCLPRRQQTLLYEYRNILSQIKLYTSLTRALIYLSQLNVLWITDLLSHVWHHGGKGFIQKLIEIHDLEFSRFPEARLISFACLYLMEIPNLC